MKLIALAVALTMSGAAVAQTTDTSAGQTVPPASGMNTDTTGTTTAPGTPTDPNAPTSTLDPNASAPAPMDPNASAQPSTTMASPSSTGPIRFAPPTTSPPPAAQSEYPVCSRTVTDSCRNPGGR